MSLNLISLVLLTPISHGQGVSTNYLTTLEHGGRVLRLEYCGEKLLVVGKDAVRLWDLKSAKPQQIKLPVKSTHWVRALSPNGSIVALWQTPNSFQLWHTDKRKKLFDVEGRFVAFSSDSRQLASTKGATVQMASAKDAFFHIFSINGWECGSLTTDGRGWARIRRVLVWSISYMRS